MREMTGSRQKWGLIIKYIESCFLFWSKITNGIQIARRKGRFYIIWIKKKLACSKRSGLGGPKSSPFGSSRKHTIYQPFSTYLY